MSHKLKMKLMPLLGILLLAFILPYKTSASDLDIFDLVSKDVLPNVLLIIDVSGSMSTADVSVAGESEKYTRLAVAKKVITEVVNDNPNVRWGLYTFPIYNSYTNTTLPGKMVSPCMYRDEAELDKFKDTIKNLPAIGGTPVSSSLAEAGLYFAGAKSFFWSSTYGSDDAFWNNNKYISPIESECQSNYIILLTDGFSSVDSGVKSGYAVSPTYYTNGSVIDSTTRYDNIKKNNIFLEDYIYDKNNNPLIIGNYITRKTNEGLDLGSKLSSFVKSTLITVPINNYWVTNLTWSQIESGSPTLGDENTGLRVNGQLKQDIATNLKNDKTPYISGYNKSDPSRPFPDLPTYSTTELYLGFQGFVKGTQIYQGNLSGDGIYGSDYLDDVAAFLNNEDLNTEIGTVDTKYEKQTVQTYTVGFKFSTDLLERAAIMGGTGGEGEGYFTADDYDELKMAFDNILSSIKEKMSVFSSPSVPINNDGSGYSGNYVYMSLFKPQQGYWLGNVKRYTLDANHSLAAYQTNGVFTSETKSDWSTVKDGNDITKGGVVESLNPVLASMTGVSNTASLRKIYTYIESNNQSQLAHTNNLFIESNTKLTENNGAILGLNSSQSAVQTAITNIRLSPMGAVIHSTPAVAYYPTETVVFVGANDGFLHAFLDKDSSAPEAWAFVMPEHLTTITKARTNTPNEDVYYVDGYISIADVDTQKVLVTGARRGGSTYAALDITSYNNPKFLFQIPSLKTSEASLWSNLPLGQSWGVPKFIETHSAAYGTSDAPTFTAYTNVKNGTFVLVPGGYDTRYDTPTGTPVTNPLGGVIVGVNAITGKPDDKFELLNSQKSNIMKHSVLDLLPLDMNSDGLVDTIYYGDLGGNMFYAWPYSQSITGYTYTAQAKFVPYILFKTENGESSGRKFMFAPAVMKKKGIEYVYFGSGDRESPTDTSVHDRFYCVHNKDKTRLAATGSATNYLTEDDLENVTANLIQSTNTAIQAQAKVDLDAASGWYINLEKGEKVVGSPVVYQTYVAFTTYMPLDTDVQDSSDICKTGTIGQATLYVVDYLTGGGAMDLNGDGVINSDDRSVIIGDSIPSAPVLTIYADGAYLFTAVNSSSAYTSEDPPDPSVGTDPLLPGSGKDPDTDPNINKFDLGSNASISTTNNVFYWREIY